MRSGASSPRRRRKWLAGPERSRRHAVAPQQPVEDRRGADGVADDARIIADARGDDAGEDGGEPAQERDRPLQRDPGGAERHQRQRDGEPALFERKGQRQRQRAERAGREQRRSEICSARPSSRLPALRSRRRRRRRAAPRGSRTGSSGRDARCARRAQPGSRSASQHRAADQIHRDRRVSSGPARGIRDAEAGGEDRGQSRDAASPSRRSRSVRCPASVRPAAPACRDWRAPPIRRTR